MTDYISSFFDNLKQKTNNPFLGTIIFVAILRYWDVAYAFFMFDDDCDMLYKQTYLYNYFSGRPFWRELFMVIVESFAVLIGTYLLLALSKFFLNVYNKHIISRMDKFTDKNSVKTKAEYDILEKSVAEVISELKKSNDTLVQQEISISSYKNKVHSLDIVSSELNTKITELNLQITNLKSSNADEGQKSANQIRLLQDEISEMKLIESIYHIRIEELRDLLKFDDIPFMSISDLNEFVPNEIINLYRTLESEHLMEPFRKIISNLYKDIEFTIDRDIQKIALDKLRMLNLIKLLKSNNGSEIGQLTEKARVLSIYDKKINEINEVS